MLRPGGRLAVMVFTREDIADAWCMDYFPSSRPWMACRRTCRSRSWSTSCPAHGDMPVVYQDLHDGSMAALLAHPELAAATPDRRAQTSYFERMQRDHPHELQQGLARLERELREGDGSAPTRQGRASVVAWIKP